MLFQIFAPEAPDCKLPRHENKPGHHLRLLIETSTTKKTNFNKKKA
jgi:hypothetical protein